MIIFDFPPDFLFTVLIHTLLVTNIKMEQEVNRKREYQEGGRRMKEREWEKSRKFVQGIDYQRKNEGESLGSCRMMEEVRYLDHKLYTEPQTKLNYTLKSIIYNKNKKRNTHFS